MARRYAESDASGSHPFQDDGVDLPAPVENESPAAPAYVPHGYEENRKSRGGAILGMALFGLCVFGGVLLLHSIYGLPMYIGILACSTSLPAFMLGRLDLQAIRAGAMSSHGLWKTRVGVWLGAVLSLVVFVWAFLSPLTYLWKMWWSWL